VIEARDGFMQAFAFGRSDKARPIALPPAAPFGITDCYIKPYACCRHIQPAVEALFGLMNDEKIDADEIGMSTSRPIASPPSTRTPAGTITPARSCASRT
jgi:2-methylcitrate dehydratase PrpD